MLRKADALIIPGTGLLNDAYTFFYWGPYDMFRWAAAAKLCGCKLLFLSVGAGPIHSRLGRFFVKAALCLADFRSYRDQSTLQFLRKIGAAVAMDPVYPDLAFSLTVGSDRLLPKIGSARPVVGIGLMEYAGKYTVKNQTTETHTKYLHSLAEFAKWLLEQQYDIRLLIGDLADRAVTKEFRSLLDGLSPARGGRVLDETAESFEELLSHIAATDFVVGTRFHNLLFSLLMGKPVIAITFHHKCSSLMDEMGLADYCQDIDGVTASKLIDQFGQLRRNAGTLRGLVEAKVNICNERLNQQYETVLNVIAPDMRESLPSTSDIGTKAKQDALQ